MSDASTPVTFRLARIIHEFFEPDTTMSEWALKRSLGFFQMSGARKAP